MRGSYKQACGDDDGEDEDSEAAVGAESNQEGKVRIMTEGFIPVQVFLLCGVGDEYADPPAARHHCGRPHAWRPVKHGVRGQRGEHDLCGYAWVQRVRRSGQVLEPEDFFYLSASGSLRSRAFRDSVPLMPALRWTCLSEACEEVGEKWEKCLCVCRS